MEIAGEDAPARLRALPTWLTNQAALAASRLVSAGLAGAGVRRHHYALLAALDEAGPANQAALSRRTTIDRSDLVATISELLDRGLVDRVTDPTDRRRNLVSITPQGRRELRKLDRLLAGVQEQFLAPLSPAERERLARTLTKVVDHHANRR
jgi:MarR family transcriptional regulator, lower aerobic nicotinate degradation pathway regulator